jgi:predicted P-loop ATPase
LLSSAPSLLADWLPGGKVSGQYYNCGDISGGPGDSLKVNLTNGLWSDFATSQTGKDLIDLYGAIHSLSNHDAALALMDGSERTAEIKQAPKTALQTQGTPLVIIQKPPIDVREPDFTIGGGAPTGHWLYRNLKGEPLFHISRYDRKGKGKTILPFAWDGKRWINKHYPAPRPLYGLELLPDAPKKAVLLVEGEKACEAARTLLGEIYAILTWPGGCGAVEKTDWKTIYNRRVLLWPDADEPGVKAMYRIAEKIAPYCTEVKIIDPQKSPNNKDNGWDAADAVAEGWKQTDVITWAKERCLTLSSGGNPIVTPTTPLTEHMPKPAKESTALVEDATDQIEITTSLSVKWLNIGLATTSKGIPIYNEENVLRIFERDDFFKNFIWYDDFHKKYFTQWSDKGVMNGHKRAWDSKIDFIRLTTHLQRNWGLSKIAIHQVKSSALQYANHNPRNEPRQWVQSLKWDGKSRIEECFSECLGAQVDQYHFDISKNFFISLVARLFHPGCQSDTMIILEGKQGTYKSTALRILGGEWYASIRHQIGTPNFFNAIQGKWLIEIAEMDSFSQSQTSAIKDMLSNPVDRFRIPYSETTEDFPRVCIFAGSTNQKHIFDDTTGGRRFWPLSTKKINVEKLRQDREQLFAEAYHRLKAGEQWYEVDNKEAKKQIESRRQHDPWEEPIQAYIIRHSDEGVTMADIYSGDCIGIPTERQDVKTARRIGKVLRMLGWDSKNVRGNDSVQRRVWKPLEISDGPTEDPIEPEPTAYSTVQSQSYELQAQQEKPQTLF